MDFTGGNSGMSSWGQQAEKAIAEGRTERQYRRNFRQKAIMAAVQAGLTGLRAGLDSSNRPKPKTTPVVQTYHIPDDKTSLAQDSMSAAEDALSRNKVNDAASNVSFGGYHTPEGLENTAMVGGQIARDTQTAEQGMQGIEPGTGMMSSYPLRPRGINPGY